MLLSRAPERVAPCSATTRASRARLARLCGLWLGGWLTAAAVQAAAVDVQVLGADGKPIAEAVAWLESPAARSAVKPHAQQEIEQKDRQFTQRVTVVPVGTSVDFPNRDKVRHHVYSVSPAKKFDLKLYLGKPANPVLFDRAGVAVLGCNIHDEMVAWVVVVPTPYFGRSPAHGRVVLADVPAGKYDLVVWHPDLPVGALAHAQPVNVGEALLNVRVQLPVQAY
jgi:plastocyanin